MVVQITTFQLELQLWEQEASKNFTTFTSAEGGILTN
jgi:hypothetical protein